jgi:hypothetical protein
MRIALVGPELEENLALRYIHSSLASAGHEAIIFDFHESAQIPELTRTLAAWRADVIGMSVVFTARARQYVALIRSLREAGYGGHITVGGHFASFHADQLMADVPELDSVLHGEGEAAMVELAANIHRPDCVRGITCRCDGQVLTTPCRPALENLDLLPWPSRTTTFHQYLGLPICDLLSSRGCFANCHFCSINAWHKRMGGPRLRQRSVEDLSAEMAYLYHQCGVRLFNFHDDNFFLPSRAKNMERFEALRLRLDEAGVRRIGIQIKARPDSVDRETIDLLKRIGLYRVFLGVESNAVAGLKALGREIRRERNHQALQTLLDAGLHATFNLLMFEPDCSLGDLRDNVDFIRQYPYVPLNFCRVEVYAGTTLERTLREQGRLFGDYYGYSYRTADWRSELAFQIFRDVFSPRNFDCGGINLMAMSVAYNMQLLKQFFPAQARPATAARAEQWIRDTNASNVDLMTELLNFAGSEHAGDPAAAEQFTADLADRRAKTDAKLGRRATAVLAEISEQAAKVPQDSIANKVVQQAASVAAAAILVCIVGSNGSCTHHTEMTPAPMQPSQLTTASQPALNPFRPHPTEMAPRPHHPHLAPKPHHPATQAQPSQPTSSSQPTTAS